MNGKISELPSNHTYDPSRNIQQQRRYSTKTSLCERRDIEKISPEWISGFTDGDASFNLSIYRDNKRKSGWSIIPSFAIELKARDLPLLKKNLKVKVIFIHIKINPTISIL